MFVFLQKEILLLELPTLTPFHCAVSCDIALYLRPKEYHQSHSIMCYWTSGQHYHYSSDASTDHHCEGVFHGRRFPLTEYLAIAENTAKLSDRRQTVSDLFLGVNSLFLAAAGFVAVSDNLKSWWAVGIVLAITVIAIVINSIWYRLIRRYRALISLRIRYLEALERALQEVGTFDEVMLSSEDTRKNSGSTRHLSHRTEFQSLQ